MSPDLEREIDSLIEENRELKAQVEHLRGLLEWSAKRERNTAQALSDALAAATKR